MITVTDLTIHADRFRLAGVNFSIPTGGYLALMGKSGSGKTTLMETICGLRHAAGGQITLMGQDVTQRKPAERGIGYVPQDGALFSAMTVGQQLAYPLRLRRWSRTAISARIDDLSALLGLTHLLQRKPFGLSGGEGQRVALGRALAAAPQILCLDEPFSALDEDARREMYALIQTIRRVTGVTTLHITHSRQEADMLADTCMTIQNGWVVER